VPRKRKELPPPLPGHIHRSDTWNGLRAGDTVEIDGVAGRGQKWTFRAFVTNDNNGAESVEVVGGRVGERKVRSFLPEQVYPVGARKAGKLSLADEPMLPF
jgi:hypothetical protein